MVGANGDNVDNVMGGRVVQYASRPCIHVIFVEYCLYLQEQNMTTVCIKR